MHVITAINVRDALPEAVEYLKSQGVQEQTRIGPALVAPGPVTIHYKMPKQHVLLDPVRDANPFFHLMESMWMLAGREDGAFLDRYIKNYSKNFGNSQGIIPDAYGYRWRYGLGFDQLAEIIRQLKEDRSTRQCVLQMWGAGFNDLRAERIKPCNLTAMFRVKDHKLHMTVTNRSNDLVWGSCGANAVHFPIMQEYVAQQADLMMGEYWQISNNLHLYMAHLEMLDKRGTLRWDEAASYEQTQRLINSSMYFDDELYTTLDYIDGLYTNKEEYIGNISNTFLLGVVIPMATAHWQYKMGHPKLAIKEVNSVIAQDWRQAGFEWLQRRLNNDK